MGPYIRARFRWRNNSPKMRNLTNFPQKMAKYLLIILLLGLLLQSSLYLYLNIFLPYSNVAENIALANQRIQIRTLAENLCSACILLYTLGHIYLVYFYHKKKLSISLKEIFSRFVLHILVSVLCVVPFALLDSFFSGTPIFIGDYIFPLKRMAIIWPVLFFIFAFACFFRKSRKQKAEE